MENTIIALDNLSASNLPELQGFKEKQLQLVSECPYVEIIDNQSYELAKKHRTALLKGRTTLESQDKLIASKLTAFRKEVASVTKELIDITLVHEEKQQSEVKRYEAIKEAEKAEKERLDNERIERIKKSISDFESNCFELVQKATFENANETKSKLDSLFNSEIITDEFDILLEQAKNRIQNAFDVKCGELQEKENQRIENERLAREKAEADEKLKDIEEQRLKEAAERSMKEQAEKEKVFEVRKNRLAEIGVVLNNGGFMHPDSQFLQKETVYDADVIDFENIFNDFKNEIKQAKENKEKAEAERIAMRKANLEAQKKAEKENKERQKRLKTDKAIIKNGLEIYFAELDLFTENQETKEFIENANNAIQDLKTELLTQLENL